MEKYPDGRQFDELEHIRIVRYALCQAWDRSNIDPVDSEYRYLQGEYHADYGQGDEY